MGTAGRGRAREMCADIPKIAVLIVESVQVEGKGRSVHVRLLFPEDMMRSIVDSMMRAFPARGLDAPPPPPAKEEAKKGRAA